MDRVRELPADDAHLLVLDGLAHLHLVSVADGGGGGGGDRGLALAMGLGVGFEVWGWI